MIDETEFIENNLDVVATMDQRDNMEIYTYTVSMIEGELQRFLTDKTRILTGKDGRFYELHLKIFVKTSDSSRLIYKHEIDVVSKFEKEAISSWQEKK